MCTVYAGLWTGDSASSWSFLQINIVEILNMGLSGVTIAGSDIGGFGNGMGSSGGQEQEGFNVVNGITDYQLLTRWMQCGAFLPWYRNHYDGYTKAFQEPIHYDGVNNDVITNTVKYVNRRYRLIQTFYDAMYQYTQTGVPICRPLFMYNPSDASLYDDNLAQDSFNYNFTNTQFFLGDNILVAPFLNPEPHRPFYLPNLADAQLKGWYPYTDNDAPLEPIAAAGYYVNVSGSYGMYYDPDLSAVPMFVQAGAIVPVLNPGQQWTGQLEAENKDNPVTLNLYPNNGENYQSSYTLYQDDGATIAYQSGTQGGQGAYRLTNITADFTNPKLTITTERTYSKYDPRENYVYLAILGQRQAQNR